MATTTNFGWDTPDDTDLVKDGAAAIRTALNGVDTSFVDLKGGTTGQVLSKTSGTDLDFTWITDATGMTNPMTTTGDTIYSSSGSTPARLGIGTTGQVLTVNSGATAPEWATPTPSASGLTLISTVNMSAVTSQNFEGVFTSTYNNYQITFNNLSSSVNTGASLNFLGLYSTNTVQTAGYYGGFCGFAPATGNADSGNIGNSNAASLKFDNLQQTPYVTSGVMYIGNVGASSQSMTGQVMIHDRFADNGLSGSFWINVARTYTGFQLTTGTGNMTGTVSVYGLAK
jgi:hypothetical protein